MAVSWVLSQLATIGSFRVDQSIYYLCRRLLAKNWSCHVKMKLVAGKMGKPSGALRLIQLTIREIGYLSQFMILPKQWSLENGQ